MPRHHERGTPEFRRFLIATVCAFANVALLQGTVPLWAASEGAGGLGAGSTWGVMMATTVLTQLVAPVLLVRYGHGRVLFASVALLAGTAPLTALSAELGPLWALGALRGAGFGLLTVTGSALVALLVPPGRRGRGIGRYGVAIGLANLACLPGGVWLASEAGFDSVFVVAGALGVLGAVLSPRARPAVRRQEGARVDASRSHGRGDGPATGRLLRTLVRPWTVMAGSAIVGGAVATFVPLAADPATTGSPTSAAPLALFGFGAATLATRWTAGELGDRFGHGRTLLPAVVGTSAGTLACGLAVAGGAASGGEVALLAAGATLAGAGFGAIQNDTLLVMFDRAGPSGRDVTSAAWNVAFDFGTGFGATVLGVAADQWGEPWVFTAAALIMAACLVPVLLDRRALGGRAGRRPTSAYG